MPRYDYDCAACGTRFEVVHGVHADPPTTCPSCGRGPIKKAFAPPTIHFKGSGWAKKERRATASPSSARSSTADEGAAPATTAGAKDTASGAASSGGEGAGGAGKGEGAASSTPASTANSD